MKVHDNTLAALKSFFMSELVPLYGEGEATNLFRIACEHYFKMDYRKPLNLDSRISESEMLLVFGMVKRLKKFEPIQYITGESYFMDLIVTVAPGVLIPRPETEELVQWIIDENPQPHTIIDLCTGSGCIALSLKNRFPDCTVAGIDISEEALRMAALNTKKLEIDVVLKKADVLQMNPSDLPPAPDIIVSNPPYVLREDQSEMSANVLEYEPHLALFPAGDDALIFYRKIAGLAISALKPGGKIYVEIHEKYGSEVAGIFCSAGFEEVIIKSDISGKPRMVRGIKTKA